jgi:hypothetical protein
LEDGHSWQPQALNGEKKALEPLAQTDAAFVHDPDRRGVWVFGGRGAGSSCQRTFLFLSEQHNSLRTLRTTHHAIPACSSAAGFLRASDEVRLCVPPSMRLNNMQLGDLLRRAKCL